MHKISLEKFEGPLDLLLQLIEKNKLKITEISLAVKQNNQGFCTGFRWPSRQVTHKIIDVPILQQVTKIVLMLFFHKI